MFGSVILALGNSARFKPTKNTTILINGQSYLDAINITYDSYPQDNQKPIDHEYDPQENLNLIDITNQNRSHCDNLVINPNYLRTNRQPSSNQNSLNSTKCSHLGVLRGMCSHFANVRFKYELRVLKN